ncbi:MAG TPA: biopolymer transporter ExbD [Desulfobulbaceae bacterium]|nr:biopolymer transporter ExbD [Desulfobulbaceae bacterium]
MDEKEFDYLNIIPLVDVMLVLLTIVLTTSTFIATGGIKVELPKAKAAESLADSRPRTVTIGPDGRLWLDGDETSLEALTSLLTPLGRETPILVRADKNLALQAFVDVFSLIKQLGFSHLSLQTEQTP